MNDNGEQNVKKFRLPSLSRPSIYHEVQFDQKLLSFFLLITFQLESVLILWGEISYWSLLGVKGLNGYLTKLILILVYFKPQQSFTTSSILTETALSRHEQSETIVMLPGPGKPQNKITATHRLVL